MPVFFGSINSGIMLGRIQSYATCFVSKTSRLATKTVYYGKVGAELSKQVYLKEGLQPPSVADFQKVYSQLYKNLLHYSVKPKEVLGLLKSLGKNDVVKYGSYAIQIVGFYSVGEIIGRRHLVGYKNYQPSHH
ncbi:hypothetical protein HG536_0G03940 [Torulaspora globosa]|uniref:ATP synthase subunit G ATP20 n=1 Tax=Torulaspora globosa TaxID=48254 RepID=A0A7G3ZLZ6_9SACH|nr:uncharacterized protein HG536_0G03940 [Torulaspora globosa]QLL34532.1 hypothetical protein HG536_0G03940 [Torulaspora globosa]